MFLPIKNLSQISYDDAMAVMQDLHAKRLSGETGDTILVLEHNPPVITKGRRLHDTVIPNEERILEHGIQVRAADRGGLLTYHGPGQIVVYFILRLEDYFTGISGLVSALETVLMEFLARRNIVGKILPDHPGIWIGNRKIASLGLRVEKGVTRHGISLNVNNDLAVYNLFDPCGLSGNTMTTLEQNIVGANNYSPLQKLQHAVPVQELMTELAEDFRVCLQAARRHETIPA